MQTNNQPKQRDRLAVSLLMCHNTGAGGTDATHITRGCYSSCALMLNLLDKRMIQWLHRRKNAIGETETNYLQLK